MQAAPIVRVRGTEDGSPAAQAVLQYFGPLISGFVRSQRQNQGAGGLRHVRVMRDLGPVRVSYDHLFGREVIEVTVRAEVLEEIERRTRPQTVIDTMLDGYIALVNFNMITDDQLEVYLNDTLLASLDFSANDEYTYFVFAFGPNGMRIPSDDDTNKRLPERPLPKCVPERQDDEGIFTYSGMYGMRDDPNQIFRFDDYGPLKLDGKNTVEIRSVKDNGRSTLGFFQAEFFSRAPRRNRTVITSWNYPSPVDNRTILTNDYRMKFYGTYDPEAMGAQTGTFDLSPTQADDYYDVEFSES